MADHGKPCDAARGKIRLNSEGVHRNAQQQSTEKIKEETASDIHRNLRTFNVLYRRC